MSTENPFLPVFSGLKQLESLSRRLELVVHHRRGLPPEILEPGTTLRISFRDFSDAGFRLKSEWEEDEIAEALSSAGLEKDQVGVAIVAEDGFLKERDTIAVFGRLEELAPELVIVESREDRPDAMKNAFRGFELSVCLYLTENLEPEPYRPHRKGTILSSASFKLRPLRNVGGIDPKPLTEQKIEQFDLLPSTVLYINCDEDILPMEEFDETFEIYIHEKILVAASHLQGAERNTVIGSLAVEALSQLVHILHFEIPEDASAPDEGKSAVLRLFRTNLKKLGLDWKEAKIFEQIKTSPIRVAALFSGIDGRADGLLHLFAGDEN